MWADLLSGVLKEKPCDPVAVNERLVDNRHDLSTLRDPLHYIIVVFGGKTWACREGSRLPFVIVEAPTSASVELPGRIAKRKSFNLVGLDLLADNSLLR